MLGHTPHTAPHGTRGQSWTLTANFYLSFQIIFALWVALSRLDPNGLLGQFGLANCLCEDKKWAGTERSKMLQHIYWILPFCFCRRAKMDIAVTQIFLLALNLLSLPQQHATVSMLACHSADLVEIEQHTPNSTGDSQQLDVHGKVAERRWQRWSFALCANIK